MTAARFVPPAFRLHARRLPPPPIWCQKAERPNPSCGSGCMLEEAHAGDCVFDILSSQRGRRGGATDAGAKAAGALCSQPFSPPLPQQQQPQQPQPPQQQPSPPQRKPDGHAYPNPYPNPNPYRVGNRVEVYFEDEGWFPGRVARVRGSPAAPR